MLDYGARWYDARLGRFISGDDIVPVLFNPMAWDRYAYVLNSPLNNVDPTGHRTCTAEQAATGDETCDQNIYDKTRTNDVLPSEDVPLTENGEKIAKLFYAMLAYTDGWWWSDGNFTLEEFMGSWVMHEASGDPFKAELIAQTIAQGLYVGHDVRYDDAACTSEVCRNGAFNLMGAKSLSTGGFLSTTDVSQYMGPGKAGPLNSEAIMTTAAAYGNAALHPTSLIWDKNNAPHNWGNSPNGTTGLGKAGVTDGYHGSQVDSIYYMHQNFLIYTPNQANYWKHQDPAVDVTDLSPGPQ